MSKFINPNYTYNKITKMKNEQPLIVEKICKTEEDYKCVLDFLLNVLYTEYDICVDDIVCDNEIVALKIIDNISWDDDEKNTKSFVVKKDDMLRDEQGSAN